MESALLIPHPASSAVAIDEVRASAVATRSGALEVSFRLCGDLDALRIPSPGAPRRADGLWRHTCFEVFVLAGDGPAYREFNLSPSGEWAAYAFHAYREGRALGETPAPEIRVRRAGGRLAVDAAIPADALPAPCGAGRWRLGLAAVLEDRGGALSHWALRHCASRPDFHRADAFTLLESGIGE